MDELVTYVFSNSDALTPRGIEEFYIFVIVVEFIGMMFSWINNRRY